MRIIADTNLLLRVVVDDDTQQSRAASAELLNAVVVAVPLPVLCEVAWVLAQGYKLPAASIAAFIRRLLNADNVVFERAAAQAGLTMLDVGGDFADGAIAYAGTRLGGETFVSFDKKAVKLLQEQGKSARLPA